MALLSDGEVEARLQDSAWSRDDRAIVREWTFADFAAALAFVNRVGEVAEAHNHHPDILLHGWNKVRLEMWNHSEGGITERDFELAGRFDELA